jgi:predicted membrane-bound spermidine synthase
LTRRLGYFGLAFGSGFAVLTIEIAGARLIAPVFGLSVVPWTAVIGVILGALAVGSHLGGRWADAGRIPLSRVLVCAGLSGALPVVGAGFPWIARDVFGFIPGAVVSALVLFAPPVLCLGAVVPYLVQADTESLGSVGRRAGDLSAAATAGSILGSFTTGFVLLPAMPLSVLLGATAGALVAMAIAANRLLDGPPDGGPMLAALVALPALGVLGSGSPPDTLHTEQTLYTSVSVTERTWADGREVRELWQNGGSSSAEYVDSGAPAHVYARVSLELLDSLGVLAPSGGPTTRGSGDNVDPGNEREGPPKRVLVLGGAALTLPVAFRDRDPRVAVDVVEIDRVVTRLAAEYFAFGGSEAGITVVHDDARVFLRGSAGGYDLVYLDVFDHLLTVPWTMVTVEALRDMSAELAPGGVFMANVLSPLEGPGTAFLERFRATLDQAFVDVRLYLTDATLDRGATQNLIVVASNDEASLPDLDWAGAPVPASGRPLTDSWAPVEYLQARVFAQGLRWR